MSAQPASTSRFLSLVGRDPIDPAELAAFLDGLSHGERVAAIRAAGRSEQRRLYAAVDGYAGLTLADLVPPGRKAFETVRHFGKNTLPAFTHFEKRFCRPAAEDAAAPSVLFGYNFQRMQPVTGPGYYQAHADAPHGEVLVDYTRIPAEAPPGWPALRSNERGLSRFIYGFMVDRLRRVSEHVSIGSAARHGREFGSWFLLCREP